MTFSSVLKATHFIEKFYIATDIMYDLKLKFDQTHKEIPVERIALLFMLDSCFCIYFCIVSLTVEMFGMFEWQR